MPKLPPPTQVTAMPPIQRFDQFAYAYGRPTLSAQFKQTPQDFIVTEQLMPPAPEGGEHLWLWVQKTGQNTDWLAKQLAKQLYLPAHAVGYAGKKDRQAVTTQWFSVPLPAKREAEIKAIQLPGVKILRTLRQPHKLKIGDLQGNAFQIALKGLPPNAPDQLAPRLQQLAQGVPNYFGTQRFGHDLNNLKQADALFARRGKRLSRNQKGLVLSAVRSWLFNHLLSLRIEKKCWQNAIEGDCIDAQGNVSGFLPGDGPLETQAKAAEWEQHILETYPQWHQGLTDNRLQPSRRNFVVIPKNLQWQWQTKENDTQLHLSFQLPKGSYATSLLRELVQLA